MTPFEIVNWGEVFLWSTLGVGVMGYAFRKSRTVDRDSLVLGIALCLFGCTDIIELHTGAWWNPPALLVFNSVCVVMIVSILWTKTRS
jgi:hypothetical protein